MMVKWEFIQQYPKSYNKPILTSLSMPFAKHVHIGKFGMVPLFFKPVQSFNNAHENQRNNLTDFWKGVLLRY